MSNDVFGRIDASWHTLLAALEGVPDDALSAPRAIGEWSVKDVLGHVAYWKGSTAERAEYVVNGGALDALTDDEPWQTTNEREAAARAGWSLDQVRDDLCTQQERAVAALRQAPAAQLADTMGDYIEHSDEHAAEIRAWRAAAGH